MNSSSWEEKIAGVVGWIILTLTILAVIWLWFLTPKPEVDLYRTKDDLTPVSISGLETKAKKAIEGLKNNSGIPIPEPTGKMGRPDPFASL